MHFNDKVYKHLFVGSLFLFNLQFIKKYYVHIYNNLISILFVFMCNFYLFFLIFCFFFAVAILIKTWKFIFVSFIDSLKFQLLCLVCYAVNLAYFTINPCEIPTYASCGQIYVITIEIPINWNDPDSNTRVCHVCLVKYEKQSEIIYKMSL